ncbi:MAG TPA: Ig-like domain-containing protein [Hyalangium sp.]|nr:Ig-like domain-containing protein [Hyalangium sp.]
MVKRNWLQALCAVVCVLALAGCGGGECDSPADCVDKKGPAPAGKEYTCVDNTCGLKDRPNPEPTCAPACAAGEFCDGAAGGQGVCRTCSATQGCTAPLFCDVAANNGKGVCRACSDTGTGTDQGCSTAAPVCDPAAGNGAGVCKACIDSEAGGAADQGCSASTPMCDPAAGNGAGVCRACVDSAQGNGQDLGCSASAPVCDPAAASGIGACKACVDSAQGTGTDLGCGDTAPICNTSANGGRGVCRACLDSAQGTDTDLGCSASAPVCDAAASNGAGVCRSCVDSAQGTDTDLGCSASSPICDPAANSGAGVCRSCADTAQGTGTDLGCGASAPICDPAANSGGGACRACLDTAAPGGAADLGCSSPTSICDTAAANGAGVCRICVATEGCPGSQTCNAEYVCEGCLDSASCTTPGTPICRPTPPPAICVECVANTDCAATRPACSTATGFCGCTDDTQCADAQNGTNFCNTAANNNRGECKICVTDANCLTQDATRPFCDNQERCIQCRVHTDCQLSEVCNSNTKSCEPVPGSDPTTSSGQIAAVLASPDGNIDPVLPIENTFVTYIKPEHPNDVAGFFLQSEPNGPAIFVSDTAALEQVQVGDRVTLQVSAKVTTSGIRTASTLASLTIISRGHPVQNLISDVRPGLVMDRSAATDVVTALTDYESEIVRLTGTIAAPSSSSGGRHVAFNITTAGITTASNNFRLRVPDTLPDEIDLVPTCQFTLKAGPMWRFTAGTTNQAQPSAYFASDLQLSGCPAPRLLSAAAASSTQVLLTFDRRIDPATVVTPGAQFTFSDGLTATGAQVNGRQVTLTTSAQTGGANYTVTVADTVKDLSGTSVSATANTATFRGFRTPAVLRITEIQPNMTGGADLIELVALTGGTVDGFVLQQDLTVSSPVITLSTFPNTTVAAGDIIVVHIAPPDGYTSETTAKDQFPSSTTPGNYDTAWDFAGGTTGITFSSRVVLVRDSVGAIQDGTSFARNSGTPPGAFPGNLQALQAAGHWVPTDCGGQPCTLTTTPTALEVSADWTAVPASNVTVESNTVRRISATDTNTKDDWAVGAPSWGAPNP